MKEIIEGTVIAPYFKRIYGSSYLYSTDGVAEWPAQAINYTNKTQFLFHIAKGIFEEYDEQVNNSMPTESLYIPYENIVYIGDSATDIPCMRLVKSRRGYSIGVFDPDKTPEGKYINYLEMIGLIFMRQPIIRPKVILQNICDILLTRSLPARKSKQSKKSCR